MTDNPNKAALDRYAYFTRLIALAAGRLELLQEDAARIEALPAPEEGKVALRKILNNEVRMWDAVGEGFGVVLHDLEGAFPELQAEFEKIETEVRSALTNYMDRMAIQSVMHKHGATSAPTVN